MQISRNEISRSSGTSSEVLAVSCPGFHPPYFFSSQLEILLSHSKLSLTSLLLTTQMHTNPFRAYTPEICYKLTGGLSPLEFPIPASAHPRHYLHRLRRILDTQPLPESAFRSPDAWFPEGSPRAHPYGLHFHQWPARDLFIDLIQGKGYLTTSGSRETVVNDLPLRGGRLRINTVQYLLLSLVQFAVRSRWSIWLCCVCNTSKGFIVPKGRNPPAVV